MLVIDLFRVARTSDMKLIKKEKGEKEVWNWPIP